MMLKILTKKFLKLFQCHGLMKEINTLDFIKDNDLLDGWLIKQRKEREQQKREKEAEKYDMDADEVFIPAHTNEDISNIQDLNDPTTKAIARSRHQQISEQESVDHANLRDVKRD